MDTCQEGRSDGSRSGRFARGAALQRQLQQIDELVFTVQDQQAAGIEHKGFSAASTNGDARSARDRVVQRLHRGSLPRAGNGGARP